MILVIDNYDSFVYNLVHYIEDLGEPTRVIRNDAMSADEVLALAPKALVVSPGPCSPKEAGICVDVIRRAPSDMPILGVCLGHQAIGEAFGGDVVSAQEIMHGRTSPVHHRGEGVFAGAPSPLLATRYHSLAVARSTCPAVLAIDAWTSDGEIMALRHRDRPIFGVQFHPESIASEHGHALISRFLERVRRP